MTTPSNSRQALTGTNQRGGDRSGRCTEAELKSDGTGDEPDEDMETRKQRRLRMSQSLLLLLSFQPNSRHLSAWLVHPNRSTTVVPPPLRPHISDSSPLPVINVCSRHSLLCILLLLDGRSPGGAGLQRENTPGILDQYETKRLPVRFILEKQKYKGLFS